MVALEHARRHEPSAGAARDSACCKTGSQRSSGRRAALHHENCEPSTDRVFYTGLHDRQGIDALAAFGTQPQENRAFPESRNLTWSLFGYGSRTKHQAGAVF
jgi:hypothetical protein